MSPSGLSTIGDNNELPSDIGEISGSRSDSLDVSSSEELDELEEEDEELESLSESQSWGMCPLTLSFWGKFCLWLTYSKFEQGSLSLARKLLLLGCSIIGYSLSLSLSSGSLSSESEVHESESSVADESELDQLSEWNLKRREL